MDSPTLISDTRTNLIRLTTSILAWNMQILELWPELNIREIHLRALSKNKLLTQQAGQIQNIELTYLKMPNTKRLVPSISVIIRSGQAHPYRSQIHARLNLKMRDGMTKDSLVTLSHRPQSCPTKLVNVKLQKIKVAKLVERELKIKLPSVKDYSQPSTRKKRWSARALSLRLLIS